MDLPQHLRTCLFVAFAASVLGCDDTGSAARPQVILYIDTNAPIASEVLSNKLLSDASIDTLRVEVLNADDEPVAGGTRDIPAPDVANWPISFGLDGASGGTVRVRLRAFRARDADSAEDSDSGTKVMVPDAGYTIDRVVDVPLPDKGAYAFRLVLDAQCRGSRPDFVARMTCVGGSMQSFRAGLEALSPEAAHDLSLTPARPAPWVPGKPEDCPEPRFNDRDVCIPGGFFMLGNRRVVGFGRLRRIDAVPAHPVQMRPFRIDRREMTVGRWVELNLPPIDPVSNPLTVTDKDCNGPLLALATDAQQKKAVEQLALNCVTWSEAAAACRAAGGRLPSEAEWEYVASGRGKGLLFPWGDTPPDCTALSAGRDVSVLGLAECPKGLQAKDRPGSHAADATSPWDDGFVFDLAGSMSEWTSDDFSDYDNDGNEGPNCWARNGLLTHPGCSSGASISYSVRGGNWRDPLEASYVALRNSHQDGDRSNQIGFRCVYPLVGQPDPLVVFTPGLAADAGSGGAVDVPMEGSEPRPEDPAP